MENENNKLARSTSKSLTPELKQLSTEEIKEQSMIYFKSGLAPSHLKNWEAVFIAMSWAQGLNIHPILGLRDIFVIDNIPSLRTEAAMSLVEMSGYCEYLEQEFEGKPYDDDFTAICRIKLKGRKEHVSRFSVKDAKIALLWGKRTKTNQPTTWITYPQRMLMYRSVAFAIRDAAPHILRGAKLYEELIDHSQYEIIEDKSSSNEVNVVVGNKKTYGGNKTINLLNDQPPE